VLEGGKFLAVEVILGKKGAACFVSGGRKQRGVTHRKYAIEPSAISTVALMAARLLAAVSEVLFSACCCDQDCNWGWDCTVSVWMAWGACIACLSGRCEV
jgi:hypothetical protein